MHNDNGKLQTMENAIQWGGSDKQWGTTNNVEIQTMRNKNDEV